MSTATATTTTITPAEARTTVSGKPNKRDLAKAQTRAKLIEAARRLWAEPGTYEAAGVREVSAAAGLSPGSIFANWASKADLWREAMGYEPPHDCAAVRQVLRNQAVVARSEAA